MSWTTVLCAAIASACLTLAAMHAFVWIRHRSAKAHLAFAFLAVGTTFFTWGCLLMMRAPTPGDFARALWWSNLGVLWMVGAVVAFVRVYFPRSRPWLGHLAWSLRLVAMIAHAVRWPHSDFETITELRAVQFLGDRVSVAEGPTSVWFAVGQLSLLVLLVFVIDTMVSAWRHGGADERRRAAIIGVPFTFFVGLGVTSAALIFAGVVTWPHVEFIPFMGVLGAMGYELSADVLRAARLSEELTVSEAALRDSENRMSIAAEAARLGMWIWELRSGAIWMTSQCRKILDMPGDGDVTYALFAARLHPDDRARVEAELRRAVDTGAAQQTDYRVVHADGSTHWITAHVGIDVDEAGRPYRLRGVAIDVSEQRNAERTAHELSGRLINAQEDERRRIARDLHDDFNQRLSLLSVELELLGRGQSGRAVSGFAQLASQIRHLSSEVHKLSYQLHPAKLDQLGLETATRSLCRDVARQSGVRVEFTAASVPPDVPPEVALCLYRIAQEALRNVVRHSRAAAASVDLQADGSALRMTVSDGGRGFDVSSAAVGLGLLSMRERAHLTKGSMVVESSPDRGTRIVVNVPLAPATRAAAGGA